MLLNKERNYLGSIVLEFYPQKWFFVVQEKNLVNSQCHHHGIHCSSTGPPFEVVVRFSH